MELALSSRAKENLKYHPALADNSTKEYNSLALATHEGINRMIMQSDLRDVYHGVHITGFHPVEKNISSGDNNHGVMNEFYVQVNIFYLCSIYCECSYKCPYNFSTVLPHRHRFENIEPTHTLNNYSNP